MSDKDQITDQDINHYLDGKDKLSSVYAESKGLKAPDHLEFKIKRMARDAEQQTGSHPVVNKNAWFVPLSIAATLVIAITLVFFLDTQKADETKLVAENENNTTQKPLPIVQKTPVPPQQTARINEESTAEPKAQQATPQNSVVENNSVITKTEPSIATNKPEPIKKEKMEQVAEKPDDFELPPHLRDMVQPTSASSDKELLPQEVLKTWTRQQWKQQVLDLQKAGNTDLADKYLEEYPKYFPGQKLDLAN